MPTDRPPPREDSDDERDDDEKDERGKTRRIVQRLISEGVRRAVEKGVEQLAEGPENIRQFVQDLKLPRELAGYLLNQIDETKNGLYRATAKEIRDFLEHTNLAEEIVRALTTLSFEIRTEIRFVPNNEKLGAKPDVKTQVRIRDCESDRPPKSAE